jgi:hypothetical protein
MRQKWLLVIIAFGWFCVGGWLFATPYLAAFSLQRAAVAGDTATISERVDFPSLRESLRAELVRRAQSAAQAAPGDPVALLGANFAATFGSTLVDATVTPEMVALLAQGIGPGGKAARPGAGTNDLDVSMGYSALSRFILDVKQRGSNDSPAELVFTRSGIANWKLSSARLP